MAYDKAVDSAALDDALDYTADRIRAKLGNSNSIHFDLENGLGFGDAVNAIPAIPAYLGHMRITPETDIRSVQIPIGDARTVLISSTHDYLARSSASAVGGIIYVLISGSVYSSGSRMLIITTSGTISYYASTSSGQSWSASDGVLTISNTSGFVFAAGVAYDFFWF